MTCKYNCFIGIISHNSFTYQDAVKSSQPLPSRRISKYFRDCRFSISVSQSALLVGDDSKSLLLLSLDSLLLRNTLHTHSPTIYRGLNVLRRPGVRFSLWRGNVNSSAAATTPPHSLPPSPPKVMCVRWSTLGLPTVSLVLRC